MIGFSLQTSAANLVIECVGVFFFYRRLERRDGKLPYLGYLCLLLLLFVYVPIVPEMSSSTAFAFSNFVSQFVRTAINIAAIYGYLRCTRDCGKRASAYLASEYVLIYMVSFNLRQASTPFFSGLNDMQLEALMIALLAAFQWGIAYATQRILDITQTKDVGSTRFGLICITIFVEMYFKFSLLADDNADLRHVSDIVFYSLCATIGVFIVFILFERDISAHEKRSELQMEQLQMQYEMQNARRYTRANADIRRLYHDMKNHLLALEAMIEGGGEPEQYITELRSRLESYDVNVVTGNAVADTLLAEKMERARLDSINFNVCADLSMFSFMNSVDMVTILGNAVDNAVEALSQLPEGQERIVYIKTARYANMAVLRISNQFAGRLDMSDGVLHTGKSDPNMHGIGLSSIQKAVKRYGGSAETEFENEGGWFRLMILIPIPEDARQ